MMSNTVGFGLTQHAEYGYQRGLGGGGAEGGEGSMDFVKTKVRMMGRNRCERA